jgi:sialic acid synthase SpsE
VSQWRCLTTARSDLRPRKGIKLGTMRSIRHELTVNVDHLDYTLGIRVAITVVGLGTTVIEKHLTIDRPLPGPIHRASLVPAEFT